MVVHYIYILLSILFFSCFNSNIDDISQRYKKGIELFEKGKYVRSREHFEYIVMNDPGTSIAVESQYYLSESLFNSENYYDASNEYVKYIRWSDDINKIEESRYRMCECAILSSKKYQNDQIETKEALALLQDFIDDYPKSIYIDLAEESLKKIRNKLAEKEYESGKLYLKLEEYESAIIYFNSVLYSYYDTEYKDKAHIGIIYAYYFNNEVDKAKKYFDDNKNEFIDPESIKLSNQILYGSITFWENFNLLYK